MACISDTTCIAVGSRSGGALVEQTTDSGGSWTTELSGVSGPPLQAVSCSGTVICVAVGDDGTVLTSDDGGSAWSQTAIADLPPTASLSSVACQGAEDCWASVGVSAGSFSMPSGSIQSAGLVEATSDGGTTWNQETWPIPAFDGTTDGQVAGANGVSLSLSCPSTGVCVGVGAVSYLISQGETTLPPEGIDITIGVLVYTDDGGENWSSVLVGRDDSEFISVSCPTTTTCIALGEDNGGEENGGVDHAFSLSRSDGSWALSRLPFDSLLAPAVSVSCLNTTSCLAVGTPAVSSYGSPVLSTSDGGSTWQPEATADSQANLEAVNCVSASSCWAVGSDSNGALILHTVTGGEAWPSVTGISPSQGPITGRTTVTITGVHFDLGVTSVSFGLAVTTDFTVVSTSEVTVTAPSAPGGAPTTVDVQVNSPLGASPVNPDDQFTYGSG